MSGKELGRAGILARVESGELKLVNAAVMMGVVIDRVSDWDSGIEKKERKG